MAQIDSFGPQTPGVDATDRGSPIPVAISGAPSQPDSQLRTIIDTIPTLAWAARPDGAAEFFNRRWLDYTGLSAHEAVGWAWIAAIHPDHRDALVDYWRSALVSGESAEFEARIRRFDGEYRWFLFRASALRDGAGRILKWYGTNTDIEDRMRAEQVARASERDFRLIVDGIPGLVCIMSGTGELEFVNRQLLQYFDRSPEELKGWSTTDAVHPDDLARTVNGWRRAVDSGRPADLEHRLRRGDGVYNWFHFRAIPLRDANGQVSRWYALLTDTEDLKRAQESLRTTQAQLSRATHIATLSELSAGIAHEINQPLAAVVANGHACYRWLSAQPPNIERALLTSERIIRDGNLAADVIRRIRALFSRSPPVKHLLSVNGVIEEVCALISDDLRANGIVLQTDLRIDLPPVAADRVQLQQIVINLARNAVEAMEDPSGRPKLLLISSQQDHDMIVVRVTDHGIGINDAVKVFEPFYSTKPNGMGMGLAICRSIAEAHGGRLWAAKHTPYGATFSLALPRASADYEAAN